MSLFLGNLSSRTQREELELEFRNYGRCHVRLKDGYGFVVYDVPANAERALEALKGKDICGQQISLTWSNRQPRPFQNSARPNRFYESRRTESTIRGRHSHNRRESMRHPSTLDRQLEAVNIRNEDVSPPAEKIGDIGEVKECEKGGAQNGFSNAESKLVESGRWGEPLNRTIVENEPPFQRYEPGCDFEEKKISGSTGSPVRQLSPEKKVNEHFGAARCSPSEYTKPKPACYNCGQLGHIMRECPRGSASRLERFGRSNDRDHNDGLFYKRRGAKLMKGRTRPLGSMNTARKMSPLRYRERSQSRKMRRHFKREHNLTESMENSHSLLKEHEGKILSKDQDGPPKKRHKKIMQRTSSCSSESASRSLSRSPRSLSRSGAHPRSRFSRSQSYSSRSRHGSALSNYKSEVPLTKSPSPSAQSAGKSMSIFSDVSAPPPVDMELNAASSALHAGHLDHDLSPRSENISSADLEIPKFKDAFEVGKMKTSLIAGPMVYTKNPEDYGCAVHVSTAEIEEEDACFAPKGNDALASDLLSGNAMKGIDGEEPRRAKSSTNFGLESEFSIPKSTEISLQEMVTVLKHYGLQVPDDHDSGSSVGEYFGASRLWPWEIIYYRRLKKGPISTENYARRIAQNKEFGIVDKYVRSSSGWGEVVPNAT